MGRTNFSKLEELEPDADVYLLAAALFISAQKGYVNNIEPYLTFLNTYFGTKEEVYKNLTKPGNAFSERQSEANLTDEERLAFFPAKNAILINADEVQPMLINAVKNVELHELLRLRAVGMLMMINEDLLYSEFLNNDECGLDEDMLKKIQCIVDAKSQWRHVTPDDCEKLEWHCNK